MTTTAFFQGWFGRGPAVSRVKPSGDHVTKRVWFGNSKNKNIREEIQYHIESFNYYIEWYSKNFLAIDVPTITLAEKFSGFLAQKEESGDLIYETGKTS